MKRSKLIDHTLLAPTATATDIEKLCAEAVEYDFCSVCVNPTWVALAKEKLAGSDVKVCTVIGFPLGANTSQIKALETEQAITNGADEIDMVMNIGFAKMGDWHAVAQDMAAVVQAASGKALVKVILETCLLTDDEIRHACQVAVQAGADFVKTSTGFSKGGATVEAVRLMRETVGENIGVKASGGVRSQADLENMVMAGANRIGASAGVVLLGKTQQENNHVY
ncbi:deoxyribose-phosphate aldolase [Alysiella crassa]|uniref:Deoxyribose-phosphate aldolase n=1 Tax=Alysiella crassa TaxID=153491 RepID=A0A376BNG5_9NEIS|nr:deoxyribose-phosphate aldolase [Alysiella crassa]UOP06710.1 deoxyribose-phosphate aldolase [Alysiella crassa]SSY71183.1 Deoxyribose-phosphate aldolase 1 [Alysiella crassa]